MESIYIKKKVERKENVLHKIKKRKEKKRNEKWVTQYRSTPDPKTTEKS